MTKGLDFKSFLARDGVSDFELVLEFTPSAMS